MHRPSFRYLIFSFFFFPRVFLMPAGIPNYIGTVAEMLTAPTCARNLCSYICLLIVGLTAHAPDFRSSHLLHYGKQVSISAHFILFKDGEADDFE